MGIKISNTLEHKLSDFNPSNPGKINLYTCGPTVYNYAHIGNLRAYIFADVLFKTMQFNEYDIDWVMNVTDVDDKTIANTIKEYGGNAGVPELIKSTDKYFQAVLSDLQKVGINGESISFVKVTEKIPDIQLYILKLIEKGYAYVAQDGSVYFSIEKYQKDFGDYGILVGEKFLEGKKIGARVKVDEYDKDNLSDFALWKSHGSDDAMIYWDHPSLGKGRPGWHIECTLINYFKFPEGTDVHTGGVDLIFPHHTNEIAQANPIYKKNGKNFVKYWVHSEHMLVDGKKMAKSAGNFYTLDDLEKGGISDGMALRYLILQSHYKSKLNVTIDSLESAKHGLDHLRKELGKLEQRRNKPQGKLLDIEYAQDGIKKKINLESIKQTINNDLDTPELLSMLSFVLSYNSAQAAAEDKLETIYKMDEVLGLNLQHSFILPEEYVEANKIPDEIKALITNRDRARQQANFALSDKIRDQIARQGKYEVIDTPDGTKLKKRS